MGVGVAGGRGVQVGVGGNDVDVGRRVGSSNTSNGGVAIVSRGTSPEPDSDVIVSGVILSGSGVGEMEGVGTVVASCGS